MSMDRFWARLKTSPPPPPKLKHKHDDRKNHQDHPISKRSWARFPPGPLWCCCACWLLAQIKPFSKHSTHVQWQRHHPGQEARKEPFVEQIASNAEDWQETNHKSSKPQENWCKSHLYRGTIHQVEPFPGEKNMGLNSGKT